VTQPIVLKFSDVRVGSAKLEVSELSPEGRVETLYTVTLGCGRPSLEQVIRSELEEGRAVFVLELLRIDSAGIAQLFAIHQAMKASSSQMILLIRSPAVIQTMRLTKVDQVFTLCGSLSEVLEILNEDKFL
jgi:anti-anti-sigma regulatory factor